MNAYPPGVYVADAMNSLPEPGPDSQLVTVEVDAGDLWGRYRITFKAQKNPRRGMRKWFWTMDSGERLKLSE